MAVITRIRRGATESLGRVQSKCDEIICCTEHLPQKRNIRSLMPTMQCLHNHFPTS